LNHRQKNLRTRDTMSTEEQTFVQKFKPPPSKVDKTRKIALRHVEVIGVSKEKGRCQTTHIEKTCRRISHRLLEDHDPQECLFSIFNSTFDAGQKSSHTDYMQLSIQSQFNTNPSRKRRIPNKESRFVVPRFAVNNIFTVAFCSTWNHFSRSRVVVNGIVSMDDP
jgi:hypothetical protein